VRIVIVEDEPLVADRIERLVGEIRPAAELRRFAELGRALEALERESADVLLLDLNLRGSDGFELLAAAVAGPAETIVISANLDRAIEAFEWGVVDFVPKPFDRKRLELAFRRLLEPRHGSPVARLAVRHAGRLEVIPADRIVAIHGAGNYTEIDLQNGLSRVHDKTLDALERALPDHFMRVHRSHILNTNAIRAIRSLPGSRYRAEMTNGRQWPVSRRQVGRLRDRLR
jgi:DNA-binding LytR/AlgR family response regulator